MAAEDDDVAPPTRTKTATRRPASSAQLQKNQKRVQGSERQLHSGVLSCDMSPLGVHLQVHLMWLYLHVAMVHCDERQSACMYA